MPDTPHQKLTDTIVRDAAHRYIASRRERIDAFVDCHFTLAGSLALHRRAIGWDLLRAPANLFLAGPALAVKLAEWTARRAGCARLSAWLARRNLLLETDVAREIEWLVATELLEIPFHRRGRAAYRDSIAEMILADGRAPRRLAVPLAATAGSDPESPFSWRRGSRAISDRESQWPRSQPGWSRPVLAPSWSSRRHRVLRR